MAKFKIDIDKCIQATLLILKELGGTADFHKVFKILYFADQKHLSRFGRPITGDSYVAMKNGPVPSNTYDILKAVRSDSIFAAFGKAYKEFFDVRFHYVTRKVEPDLDWLSETDVECLNESIGENKDLGFFNLTEKSHDAAYDNAVRDNFISPLDIARVGGANDTMLQYISLNIENQRPLS